MARFWRAGGPSHSTIVVRAGPPLGEVGAVVLRIQRDEGGGGAAAEQKESGCSRAEAQKKQQHPLRWEVAQHSVTSPRRRARRPRRVRSYGTQIQHILTLPPSLIRYHDIQINAPPPINMLPG